MIDIVGLRAIHGIAGPDRAARPRVPLSVSRQGDTGLTFTASWELDGQPFLGLNGGLLFPFTE